MPTFKDLSPDVRLILQDKHLQGVYSNVKDDLKHAIRFFHPDSPQRSLVKQELDRLFPDDSDERSRLPEAWSEDLKKCFLEEAEKQGLIIDYATELDELVDQLVWRSTTHGQTFWHEVANGRRTTLC